MPLSRPRLIRRASAAATTLGKRDVGGQVERREKPEENVKGGGLREKEDRPAPDEYPEPVGCVGVSRIPAAW